MAEEQRDVSALGYRLKAAPENGTNVEEMELSGSEPRTGMGRDLCSSQAGAVREFWGRACQQARQDLKEEPLLDREAQCQGLVETIESPLSGRGNSPQRKLSAAEDAEAFLRPCKGMANICHQPRKTKAAQASLGLCMESEVTDGGFRCGNKPRSKKESFRKIIVNLPEEDETSSFLVIKQESDWDTSSLAAEAIASEHTSFSYIPFTVLALMQMRNSRRLTVEMKQ
ncbi:UNVERIFIED_CONTAM: hypothetical protein K2H54_062067 [Gekko kuhli]